MTGIQPTLGTKTTLGITTISFNQAQFLPECLASVTMKATAQLRYVIVDPGSADGSREIISRETDKFFSIIMTPDQGPADGLNKGFAACDADVYGYLNSDDRFAPGALDFVADFFESHPDVDILMGAVRMINESGQAVRRCQVPWRFSAQNFVDGTCMPLQQGTFFRRSAWEKTTGFNVQNRTCWDTELLLDMVLAGSRIQTVNKVLGEFRIHSVSITGSGHLQGQYLKDQDRLKAKAVKAAGVRPSRGLVKLFKQSAYRVHPVRRSLEWLAR